MVNQKKESIPELILNAGNGFTDALLITPSGKIKSCPSFPSIRAEVTGQTLGLDEFEIACDWVEFEGVRYVVGYDVITVGAESPERHLGETRYGSLLHVFLAAYTLAKLNVKQGPVNLTLFAPPKFFNAVKPQMQKEFMASNGELSIHLKGEKTPRTWFCEKVTVYPECLGAGLCLLADANGKLVDLDMWAGTVLVLDPGAFSLDALKIVNGRIAIDQLQHATWEAGVDKFIRQKLLLTLHTDPRFRGKIEEDVDKMLIDGFVSGDFSITSAGVTAPLTKQVNHLRRRYADYIMTNILASKFNNLDDVEAVLVAGGGGVLIHDHLTAQYGEYNPKNPAQGKIINLKKFPHTKGIHPAQIEVHGAARWALSKRK